MKKAIIFLLVLAFAFSIMSSAVLACTWDGTYPDPINTPYKMETSGGGDCHVQLSWYLNDYR